MSTPQSDAGNTNTHTLSAYVRRIKGGTVNNTIAQLYWQGSAQAGTTYTDVGGGWWRLSYTAAGTASAQNYGVTLVEDSGTLYIDGIQLEQKSYPTTYADGTLGTGYSWSGTAHESTSTRTAANVQYAGGTSNFTTDEGSMSLWVKSNLSQSQIASTIQGILNYETSGDGFRLEYNAYPTAEFRLNKVVGYSNNIAYKQVNIAANTWYHLAATWNSTTGISLYLNAGTPGTNANTTDPGNTSTILLPSSSGGTIWQYSDIRIFEDDLSAAEVTDLYQSGLVSHSEGIEVDAFSDDKGQNPVAVWHFDEGYGTTASDSSPYGNHLTISGATWNTTGIGGQAQLERNLSFDGTDDYLTRNADTDFNFGTR